VFKNLSVFNVHSEPSKYSDSKIDQKASVCILKTLL